MEAPKLVWLHFKLPIRSIVASYRQSTVLSCRRELFERERHLGLSLVVLIGFGTLHLQVQVVGFRNCRDSGLRIEVFNVKGHRF